MSEFSERLLGLMQEQSLDRKTLAKNAGINASCITHYLSDKRQPTVKSLIKIADYFNCSTDFLLGREEENRTLTFKTCPPFSERLAFIKAEYNFSAFEIYTFKDLSKSCYYDWINGKRQPTVENVIRLSEKFQRRVDYIIGRES